MMACKGLGYSRRGLRLNAAIVLEVGVTEAEWNTSGHPGPMLELLQGRASNRQLRLFACACCRSIWGHVPDGPCRNAVEVSQQFAYGEATADQLAAARKSAIAAASGAGPRSAAAWAACEAANPSALYAAKVAADEACEQVRRHSPWAADDEARAQAGFLRDIVGNLFRELRPSFFRRWAQDPRIQNIVAGARCGELQEDMKALGDELERLGCPKLIVEHCRSSGPHVRGCWALELLEADGESSPSPATDRIGEVRRAFAEYLGPKKYRRCVRKAVDDLSVGPPKEWIEFVGLHRTCVVSPAELVAVLAVCTVHGCDLVERVVRGAKDDPTLGRDSEFLQARGTCFPHSHGDDQDGVERRIWWCPECQRERAEWMTARAAWMARPMWTE